MSRPGGRQPDSDPTSTDPEDWPVGRLLSVASRRVERSWNMYLATWDLNHASLPVLLHLFAGARSQRELADALGVTEQTMSRIIARLERTGLLTRTAATTDRRRRDVVITADGRRAAAAALDSSRAQTSLTQALDAAELEQLRALLIRVVRTPETHPQPIAPTRNTEG